MDQGFGDMIRCTRIRRGMTQQQVVEKMVPRITRASLSQTERGQHMPPPAKALQLGVILGIDKDLLLDKIREERTYLLDEKIQKFRDKPQKSFE